MNETLPEYFDLYDTNGHPLGRAKPRDAVHRDGDWHRSAHIWIFTSDGRLLFQRRAAHKDTWPGRLDASIGGHYRAGEEGAASVVREAWEELGLRVERDELILLGERRIESREPGVIDREIQDIFLLRRDVPLTAYQPQDDEIAALTLLDARAAARLHSGEIATLGADVLSRGAAMPRRFYLTADDLIPHRGPYIAAVARGVKDVLAGRPPGLLQGEWDREQ